MSTQTSLFGEGEPERKKSKVPPKIEEIIGEHFDVKRFLENFDLILEATGGPKKLKELVLHLAVSGRLLAASRETAEPFLRGLEKSRARLAESGIRCRSDYEPVSAEEYPYSVPEGWRWLRVGELGGFLGGGTPSKSNDAFWKGAIPWVSPKDMKRPFIDDAEDHISEAAVQGSAAKVVPSPSVLFVLRGMILAHSFPVAVTRRAVAINQDMRALVLASPEMQTFVLRVFQAARDRVLSKIERSSHGTCRLDAMVVENLPIAIPPLAEQKRIVAKVDELMALIDALEANQTKKREVGARLTKSALDALTSAEGPEEFDAAWKRVVENFDVLIDRAEKVGEVRTAILSLAIHGKLVRQQAEDESARVELERIEKQRERLIAEKVFRRSQLPAPETAGSFEIPCAWVWTHLGNAMLNVTDGFHSTPKPVAKGVPYITAKHVKPELIDFESCLHVSPSDFGEIASKTRPSRGDVLVVNIGAGCGLPSIIEVDFEFAFKNVAILNRPDQVDPKFLFNYLMLARADIFDDRTKGGAQPFLSLGMLREIPFPLPPLAEQRRIVAKVDSLMKICDELEAKLRLAEERAARLAEAAVLELVA